MEVAGLCSQPRWYFIDVSEFLEEGVNEQDVQKVLDERYPGHDDYLVTITDGKCYFYTLEVMTEEDRQDIRTLLRNSIEKRGEKPQRVAVVGYPSAEEHVSMAEPTSAIVSTMKSGIVPQPPTSIIAPLYNGLMSSLKFILRYLRQQKPEPSYYQSLERSAISLLLWGNEHAVSNDGLDKALLHSKLVQDSVVLVLVLISGLVTRNLFELLPTNMHAKFFEICDIVSVTQIARSTMQSPDDLEMYQVNEPQRGKELCDTIQMRIDCLQIIDTSLICPVKRGSEHQRPMARHRTETSDKMTFEPSPLESRNLFIRAPSLDYPPNGPIKIGNVITDMFRPQDPIAQLEPLAEIITMASSNEGTRKRGDHGSARLDASAKLCAAFGSQAKGKRSTNMRTVYDFNNVETLMLERNPRVTEIIALCDAEPKVQYALKRRPIYVITGLKVARGLRYSIIQSRESEVGLSTQGNVTKEDAVQAHLDSSAGTDGTESYTVFGDVILAYRLHVIKKAGWKRRGEADLKIGAGFLSTEEMRLEGEVETKSLSAQDLKHFAEDEGYETGSILMTDDEEAWSMACVED